jgi:uncharacterized protein (TIGR02646 family)
MRWIRKTTEPHELLEWRAGYKNDVNFGYDLMRSSHNVINAVTNSLLEEQGWLCAYTGLRIESDSCHIEHIRAQTHCKPSETVAYNNMLACFPAPNPPFKTPYGAEKKESWPPPHEQHLFVSPLDQSCETRFLFNLNGKIRNRDDDQAARTTGERLGLDHPVLESYRKSAIQGTLGKTNNLPIKDARQRLRGLMSQQSGRLEPFCFVLVQALEKHIRRLEFIAKSKKKRK